MKESRILKIAYQKYDSILGYTVIISRIFYLGTNNSSFKFLAGCPLSAELAERNFK